MCACSAPRRRAILTLTMTAQSARPPRSTPLHPELEEHRASLRAIQERARALTEGLTDEQARWRPAAGRWSIVECLDHLNRVDEKVLPAFDRAIRRGRGEGLTVEGAEPFSYGWLEKKVARSMEPPVRRRWIRAPKIYAPPAEPTEPLSEVLRRFDEIHDELIVRVEAADGLDLAKVKMSSPIAKLFKMGLGPWFSFLEAHDRRHLWQAEEVRKAFPVQPGLALP